MQHTVINTEDVVLHTALAGPEDGPPLVLLHGFPEFWYGWHNQIQPLAAAGFRVIAPDQRGYNLSDKPKGVKQYDIDRLAADVIGLVRALGYDSVNLTGHDWGAAVAWHTASRHPEVVRKLAILNVPHPEVARQFILSSPKQTLKSWYIGWFQLPLLPELSLRLFGTRMMLGTAQTSTFSQDDLERYRAAWAQAGAPRGMINWYRAMARRVLGRRPPVGRVTVPVLMLWGMQDAALNYQTAEASLPYADDIQLVTFEDATHWVQHDEAEAVNAALIDFFSH